MRNRKNVLKRATAVLLEIRTISINRCLYKQDFICEARRTEPGYVLSSISHGGVLSLHAVFY